MGSISHRASGLSGQVALQGDWLGSAAEAIAREADGHPLFIDELVRHVATSGDHSIDRVRLDDALETLETAYPDKLRGLLPRIYAGSNLARANITGLINLFSKD